MSGKLPPFVRPPLPDVDGTTARYCTGPAGLLIAQESAFEFPAACQVANLYKLDDEDTWIGTINVFNGACHVYLIRVHDVGGVQEGTCDPNGRLDEASRVSGDGAFATVDVPGLTGEYVVLAISFGE